MEKPDGYKLPNPIRSSIDESPTDVQKSLPSLHIFYKGDTDTLNDADDRREARAMCQWVNDCGAKSISHGRKAARLRRVHIILTTAGLISSAISSTLSGISTNITDEIHLLEITLCALALSAVAAVVVGFNGLMDPSARRNAHLLSENNYLILGRDIAVYLAGIAADCPRSGELDVTNALRDYQRRLDNLDSVAPVI